MVCPHGQGGGEGVKPVRTFCGQGEESLFRDFVQTSFQGRRKKNVQGWRATEKDRKTALLNLSIYYIYTMYKNPGWPRPPLLPTPISPLWTVPNDSSMNSKRVFLVLIFLT